MSVEASVEQGHQALAEPGRPAPPCTVVIFGAAGDLTKRKLVPALYNLKAARAPAPASSPSWGSRGASRRTSSSARSRRASIREFATTRVDEALWAELRERDVLPGRRAVRPGRLRAARGPPGRDREAPWHRGERALLPRHPAEPLRRGRAPARRGRARRRTEGDSLAAGHRREAVRPRPRIRPGAQRRAGRGSSARTRSTGSTTTSARRPSRTSWSSASPTACSSRSGTGRTSTTSS